MTAAINSIGSIGYYRPTLTSVVRNSNVRQLQMLRSSRDTLVESNNLRREYINSLEEYTGVIKELQISNENLIVLHKEHRQLIQESRDIGQKRVDLHKKAIRDLNNWMDDTRTEVLALFDKKNKVSVPVPIQSDIKPSKTNIVNDIRAEKTINELKTEEKTFVKESFVDTGKKIDVIKVEEAKQLSTASKQTGKVFDYVPHQSAKEAVNVSYQPTINQLQAIAMQKSLNIPENKRFNYGNSIGMPIKKLFYYSQKNILESITNSLIKKLV